MKFTYYAHFTPLFDKNMPSAHTTLNALDFRQIRGQGAPDKRDFFEQLVCQLAKLDNTESFRRIHGAGGDGGVEALCVLPNGDKIGYQAKFYPDAAKINWNAIDDSVRTALTHHPDLIRYVIALPCDFTGRRAVRNGVTDGVWGTWDDWAAKWDALATAANINVVFEPWTAFELQALLMRPEAHHFLSFFFDQLTFSQQWVRDKAQSTRVALHARYSPDDHVPTESLKPFDVILRRLPVRAHLDEIFDTASASALHDAQRLTGLPPEALHDVHDCEVALAEFLKLRADVNAGFDQPWPVQDWFERWDRMAHSLSDYQQWLDRVFDDDKDARDRTRSMTRAYDLSTKEIFAGNWARLLPIDTTRAVLMVGRAGAGKSHALAHAVQTAIDNGVPAIHILGQHILDDDPRTSILKQLELGNWKFSDLLAGLNLAAEAVDGRALLVIDGINEGRGLEVWHKNMASFLHDIKQHDRVVLVMSCREEYLDYVVPTDCVLDRWAHWRDSDAGQPIPGKLIRVDVSGFSTFEEQENALRQFMDKNGIARPGSMMLDPELFNPLFMSSVCRSMVKANVKCFPQGIHGARTMFNFVLETKCHALGTPHDANPALTNTMRAALNALAESMVRTRLDKVPMLEALSMIDQHFRAYPLGNMTWLSVLEGADILRRDIEEGASDTFDWNPRKEVVRFAFQRLQDNLMAQHLVNQQAATAARAFDKTGGWAFLINRKIGRDGNHTVFVTRAWIGLMGSLWAQISELQGIELCDMPGLFEDPWLYFDIRQMREVFRVSLREREPSAFTARTTALLDVIWEDAWSDQWEIYMSFACIPGHPWNAQYLASKLEAMPDDLLEQTWKHKFDDWTSCTRSAESLLDWLTVTPTGKATPEVLQLGLILATWLQQVSNANIQEKAAAVTLRLHAWGR